MHTHDMNEAWRGPGDIPGPVIVTTSRRLRKWSDMKRSKRERVRVAVESVEWASAGVGDQK